MPHTKTKLTTLVIKSSEWMRGTGETNGRLLDSKTKTRCCVGIRAKSLGIADEDILDVPWPTKTDKAFAEVMRKDRRGSELSDYEETLLWYLDEWEISKHAAEINDAKTWRELKGMMYAVGAKDEIRTAQGTHHDDDPISDDDRIALLRPVFKDKGIQIDWRPDE